MGWGGEERRDGRGGERGERRGVVLDFVAVGDGMLRWWVP